MTNQAPKLIILCGIPFAGKTTLAKKLERDLGFVRIDLDEIKFEFMGNEVRDEEIDQKGWDKIYQDMYRRIGEILNSGREVIHDTGNFTVYERGLISYIAKKIGVGFVTVYVDTPVAEAKSRMIANRSTKQRFDITDKAFEDAVAEMEIPLSHENPIRVASVEDYEFILNSAINGK